MGDGTTSDLEAAIGAAESYDGLLAETRYQSSAAREKGEPR